MRGMSLVQVQEEQSFDGSRGNSHPVISVPPHSTETPTCSCLRLFWKGKKQLERNQGACTQLWASSAARKVGAKPSPEPAPALTRVRR